MKWNEILRNEDKKVALLVSESNTQFVVAFGYDPDAPEDQKWQHGHYFPFWMDSEKKAEALADAMDLYRSRTDSRYISRLRLEEIATSALHELREVDNDTFLDFCEEDLNLTEEEREWFGLDLTEDEQKWLREIEEDGDENDS